MTLKQKQRALEGLQKRINIIAKKHYMGKNGSRIELKNVDTPTTANAHHLKVYK